MKTLGSHLGTLVITALLLVHPSSRAQPPDHLPDHFSGQWTKLVTSGQGPSARSTPVTAALDTNVYVFGGVKDDFATAQNLFYNDLYRFDTRSARWTPLTPTGAAPPPRAFAAGVGVPKRDWVVVFGGANYSADYANILMYSDLWAYDVNGNRWTQLNAVNVGPAPRSRPTMWLEDDSLYVFGGVNAAFETFNDLWRYDLRANRWERVHAGGNAPGVPPTRHEAAAGAHAHAGSLTLYGGESATSQGFVFLNDTWEFDLRRRRWYDVTPAAGSNVNPPHNYGATVLLGHRLFMAGGDVPGGSSGCGAPFAQNPTNDLWQFDLGDRTWRRLQPRGDTFPSLKRINAAAVRGQMFVFAGYGFTCVDGVGGQTWNTAVYAYSPR